MKQILKKIDQQTIIDYQRYLTKELDLSPATAKRRLSSLRKFCNWAYQKGYLNQNPIDNTPQVDQVIEKLGKDNLVRKAYKKYHNISATRYLHWGLLIIFCAALGFGAYDQFFKQAETPLAYPDNPTRPNRYLSFQGRLTDSSNNPISSSTNIVFQLWDQVSGGTEGTCTSQPGEDCLWTSITCSVVPDQDGIFSILLGKTSGPGFTCSSAIEIPATVFSENQDVYLAINVAGDGEMDPRVQVATVGYALNAETLQGLPPGTGVSSIPYIDSTGKIVIAAASPMVQATSGAFSLEGQTGITIQVADGQDGNINLAAKGTGTINLTTEAETGDLLDVQSGANFGNTGGKEANNLIYGYIGNNSTNANLLKLEAGSTPEPVHILLVILLFLAEILPAITAFQLILEKRIQIILSLL